MRARMYAFLSKETGAELRRNWWREEEGGERGGGGEVMNGCSILSWGAL